jgi:predicted SprT family Zn-dependent metalloprotease
MAPSSRQKPARKPAPTTPNQKQRDEAYRDKVAGAKRKADERAARKAARKAGKAGAKPQADPEGTAKPAPKPAPVPQSGKADRDPTKEQYRSIQGSFGHFNQHLFDGKLPPLMLSFSKHRGAHGYFKAPGFIHRKATELPEVELLKLARATGDHELKCCEIALNPETLGRTVEEVMGTLCHEMTHWWQYKYGKSSRPTYHNQEWSNKMVSLGLQPYEFKPKTGGRTGRAIGQAVSQDIVAGGPFDLAMRSLPEEYKLPWIAVVAPKTTTKAPKKVLLKCPDCERKIWREEDDTAAYVCPECDSPMLTKAQEKEGGGSDE